MNSFSGAASSFSLEGSVALVTGSSRGIGYAIACGLAEAGATIVLNCRHRAALADVSERLAGRFGESRVFACAFDVTSETDVARGISWVEENAGPTRILVNNAGVQHRSSLLELTLGDWERVIRTNLTSPFLVGREAARYMIARGRGKIVNIASLQSDLARPSIAAYTAAKGGLRNLTRAMAAEWAPHGLQINAIAPGYMQTEMTRALVQDPAFGEWVIGRTPAGRWGDIADLLGAAVWLASGGSDFVNGQTIFVDGGMSVVV